MEKKTIQHESVGRIIRIISCFCDESSEWGVRELAAFTSLPKSTVHRILQALMDLGWLTYDTKKQHYKVGSELYRISSVISQRIPINDIARPFLEEVCKKTGEATILCL